MLVLSLERISLTRRLALLFAASTALVSLVAGLLFNQASERHFRELDEQLLASKLEVHRQLLGPELSAENLNSRLPALQEELRRHPELQLQILGAEGLPWFNSQAQPAGHEHEMAQLRTLQAPLDPDRPNGPQLRLSLDIRHHQHFLAQMQRLIWLTMGLAALATALLGGWLARQGLQPLQQLTQLSQRISAGSLDQRLDSASVPSEMRPMLEAFNAMLARLEDAFARLSGFSADIAHELRTPLSNLITQTQVTLSQPRSSEVYFEALHDNLEELQQLSQMVNDMLFLAKAEHGLLPTRCEPLQLGQELNLLAEYYTPLAEDRQVHLSVLGEATASADRGLLRRALSNLIDNALRFTPPGGELRLTASSREGLCHLEVANQGATIAAEQCQRLFDRFYRADPARREGNAEHAGLGLAITRSIVRAHGGEIRCESANGWTRFILELPA
ncbi:two-component system heavy metal sensor histidine kinase CusS [Pseudomonas fluvialis]|uniref:Sensor protein n=1 Tax=Pseudomonas fluvialis TaxID=1793966 RepID=A0A7X0BVD5_9PSED|nr:two-component system heavy metal sensor histidine kinase CusS [Pseudomonas fluvialis]